MNSELKPGIYKHYKGGLYEVVGVANHSETPEKLVIYKSLKDGRFWARPLKMFTEIIEVGAEKIPRFKFLE